MKAAESSAWQLDFFGEATQVITPQATKPDPLPDPHLWSASVVQKMIDALIDLARDSRRGDAMPESLMDCADLLSQRLRCVDLDRADYAATLGWIMGYWDGALPYKHVCSVNAIDPETMQDVILNSPILSEDLRSLKARLCGTLI